MAAERNHRLEQAIADAGSMSAKALGRAVRELAARDGVHIAADHTAVSRWLSGTIPRERTCHYIAQAISDRTRRTVTLADIGFAPTSLPSPDLGLTYDRDLSSGLDTIAELWRADLRDVPDVVQSHASPAAWSELSLTWLVGTRGAKSTPLDGDRQVGLGDVARLRATTDSFAHLDNRFGGAHGRTALVHFLAHEVQPMLRGRHTARVHRELFTAAAEAMLLTAWMSYDSCRHGLAQRYFTQALRLADAAGDRLVAATIMSAMSHQATFVGRYQEAAQLARVAVAGIATVGTDTLRSQFHAMEARALARLGDARGCDGAMTDAVRLFERRRVDDDPAWIAYFDEAELAAELGHCTRDLGRADAAVLHASHSLSPTGDYVRSDFFATMVKADAHAAAGDLEEAASVVEQALMLGAALTSARCGRYLREFRERVFAGKGLAVLARLDEQYVEHPLWRAAAA